MTQNTDACGAEVDCDKRRFLKQAGVMGGAVATTGLGMGISSAQVSPSKTIKLGGKTAGWQGRAPSSIEGETNPTLELLAGKKYTLTWENMDGAPHNIAILNKNGDTVVRTEIISGRGATQTVTFTASDSMTEYLCEVHPTTMRGQVSVSSIEEDAPPAVDEPTTMANQTNEIGVTDEEIPEGGPYATETAVTDPNPSPKVRASWPPVKTWTMKVENGKFVGVSDSIKGETNPTLTVQAGKTYAIKIIGTEKYARTGQRPNVIVSQSDYPIASSPFLTGPNDSETEAFVFTDGPGTYFASAYTHARGSLKVKGSVTTRANGTTTMATDGTNVTGDVSAGHARQQSPHDDLLAFIRLLIQWLS